MAKLRNEKALQRYHVSPPQETVVMPPPLALTALDLIFYPLTLPVRNVFFYKLEPDTFATFLDSHLPTLKHSLSLALQRFYPLAGRLIPPPGGAVRSMLCYSEGDGVVFSVTERDDDFEELMLDGPKDASLFHGLAPPSLPLDERGQQPVLELKVTMFPEGHGVALGVSTLHAAADGYSSLHFIKTWASFCRGEGGGSIELPVMDRSMIADPGGLGKAMLATLEERQKHAASRKISASKKELTDTNNNCNSDVVVLATFHVTKAQVEALRRWVAANERGGSGRYSTFALATALVWTVWVRIKRDGKDAADNNEWLLFPYDLRGRFAEAMVPIGYLGNCVGSCLLKIKTTELLGENGLAAAAAAVRETVLGLTPDDIMAGTERVGKFFKDMYTTGAGAGRLFTWVGSPRLGLYGLDFGWGNPEKVEIISIETTGAVSMAEGKEEGSLRIGIALPRSEMEEFAAKLDDSLRTAASCAQ